MGDFGDYMVIIEDDDGVEIGRVLQSSDFKLPEMGHTITINLHEVKDRPHLARRYRIRDIDQQERPNATKTRRTFKIPYYYVRIDRSGEAAAVAGDSPQETPQSGQLGKLDGGGIEKSVAADIARVDRQLATELDDLADELALLINDGQGGALDRSLVDRLSRAGRVAKRNSFRALVHSKSDGEGE